MIIKWYEVICDKCGKSLNHYIGNKPTRKKLIADGFVVVGDRVYCNEICCYKIN